jgi:hypothetical protein
MAGAKKQHEGGTGGRVNEPPGMDGRKSERSIVPMSPGNQTRRDPEEGRGRQGMEPVEGKMARALDLGTVSTTLHRIAELGRPAGAWRSTAPQRNHVPEEPDAGIPHVRICGGPGRATARVYPTPFWHPSHPSVHIHTFGDCGAASKSTHSVSSSSQHPPWRCRM